VPAGARIFHYGWVQAIEAHDRRRALAEVHLGADGAAAYVPDIDAGYDFGQLHGRAPSPTPILPSCASASPPATGRCCPPRRSAEARPFSERAPSSFREPDPRFKVAEHRNYVLLPP
jgi:hypothetical protein